jgi:hypothetical protein
MRSFAALDPGCGIQISNSSILRSHSFAISPHDRASFILHVPPAEHQRAQGMPGARCARSLVCSVKKHTS